MPSASDLHPAFRPIAESMLARANMFFAGTGVTVHFGQTFRSVQTQDSLYAKGRTIAGNIVTYVRGGDSLHNYGLAFDMLLKKDGKPTWENALYRKVGTMLASAFPMVVWGGNFPKIFGGNFVDLPHFQYHPGWTPKNVISAIKKFLSNPNLIPMPDPSPALSIAVSDWKRMNELSQQIGDERRKQLDLTSELSASQERENNLRDQQIQILAKYPV